MDLIEIRDNDYLAECAGSINFDNWLIYDWQNYVLTYFKQLKHRRDNSIHVEDLSFSLGDDHVELTNSVFETEPHTEIEPQVEGRLTTCFLITTIKIKDGKLKGKMCIRSMTEPPIHTEYEIFLKTALMKMTIGLSIIQDGLDYDDCKYKFSDVNLTFMYSHNSQTISVFDKIKDISKRKLLERYILEYITKDLCCAVESYQVDRLSIKQSVSELCGNDYSLKNKLRMHNKKLHVAFNKLVSTIIDFTNKLVNEKSLKVVLTKLLGLVKEDNDKKILKSYKCYLTNLNTLAMVKDKNVIISNEGDLVILHAPVEFENLNLHYKESSDQVDDVEEVLKDIHSYTTSGAYIIISLKKINENEVKFNLIEFKVPNFKSLKETNIDFAMDYLVSAAIEEHLKPLLQIALTNTELNELAIKPDIYVEDSEAEEEDEEDEEDEIEED